MSEYSLEWVFVVLGGDSLVSAPLGTRYWDPDSPLEPVLWPDGALGRRGPVHLGRDRSHSELNALAAILTHFISGLVFILAQCAYTHTEV